jgi:hypothetical protein
VGEPQSSNLAEVAKVLFAVALATADVRDRVVSNSYFLETDAVVIRDGFLVSTSFWSVLLQSNKRMTTNIIAIARGRSGNVNHHLWNNHGTWWCHLTLHLSDFTKLRWRLSLDTRDVDHARQIRDSLLALLASPL